MTERDTTPRIVHRPEASRFEAIVDGFTCVAEYQINGTTMAMTHTKVPSALEGRGIAAALVREALTWARSQGLKVNPICSYVQAYIKRHPEWQDLLP